MTSAPEILWRPAPDLDCALTRFQATTPAADGSYFDLWRWSTTDLNAFWLAVWEWFDIPSDVQPTIALADDAMPGARWFPEVRLNYAEAMLRMPGRADDDVVVIGRSQSRDEVSLTAAELRDLVARVRRGLQNAGVGPGDRVAAYAPNIPETLALLMATASLGAIFSSCAPEFGQRAVIDRLSQIEPKVLVAVDGYVYGTKPIDRRADVAAIADALPTVSTLVWLPYLPESASSTETSARSASEGARSTEIGARSATSWAEFTAADAADAADASGEGEALAFERVPFDHPLYVLYSSGTTGLPKPIVHGHGGITIEHLKALGLQTDIGPSDRFFWFSTTGWMMWNYLVSALGVGATVVMFDGNPGAPDLSTLWQLADELGVTYFGTSAPFLMACSKAGLRPRDLADLSSLRGIGSTGAPLPVEGFEWVYDAVTTYAQLGSLSGGTDVCTGFLGTARTLPVTAGELAAPCLGAAVAAYGDTLEPVVDQLGELVIEKPMPSMPVGFWGDDDGSRYRAAYFEDIPGVWRHGDWITITSRGTSVVTGRSDATLNRGGVRLGTAEFYAFVDAIPEVADSLVVHLEGDDAGTLILFVQLTEGTELTDELQHTINTALRDQLSPRHVPDAIEVISEMPRTLSGKRIEVPVKRILQGVPAEKAVALGALTSTTAIPEFEALRNNPRYGS
ncbi:MAG: acetoacetate--CoA ligase [Marmoricola sp.]